MWAALNKVFQGEEEQRKPQEGKRKPEPVTLNIYDLADNTVGLNGALSAVGTGAYHAGVEVYGIEFSFGRCEDPNVTGICCVPPKGCTAHPFRESLPMGDTSMTKKEVEQLMRRLCMEWMSMDYDILRNNCCHFSAELCKQLGVGPVPSWVTSLAGVGAVIRSGTRLAVKGVIGAPYYAAQGVISGAQYVEEAMGGEINLSDVPEKSRPMVRQLIDLGFSKRTAVEAAKRTSSVEAAMDWITSNYQ